MKKTARQILEIGLFILGILVGVLLYDLYSAGTWRWPAEWWKGFLVVAAITVPLALVWSRFDKK